MLHNGGSGASARTMIQPQWLYNDCLCNLAHRHTRHAVWNAFVCARAYQKTFAIKNPIVLHNFMREEKCFSKQVDNCAITNSKLFRT